MGHKDIVTKAKLHFVKPGEVNFLMEIENFGISAGLYTCLLIRKRAGNFHINF